jgi:glycine/D-amino acid oxidase-like deaminating enzyme
MNTLQKFDLVIIGGGILGLLAALKVVQEKPNWRIAIYDRDLIGSGATRYSLGMSYSYAKSVFRKTLTEESLPEWDSIQQLIPGLPMRRLNLYGFSKHENLDKTINNFVTMEASPSKPKVLADENKSTFLKQFPWLLLPDKTDLLEANYADEAYVMELAKMMADYLREKTNVEIYETVAIEDWDTSKAKRPKDYPYSDDAPLILRASDGQSMITQYALLTPGPWVEASFWKSLLQPLKIRNKKIISFHFEIKPDDNAPVIFAFDEQAFFIPSYKNKYWLLSVTSPVWDITPDDPLTLTRNDREHAFNFLEKFAPSFIPFYRGGRVFCDAYGPDLNPVICSLGDNPRLIYAGAGSGSGFRLGPAIANRAIKMILDHARNET